MRYRIIVTLAEENIVDVTGASEETLNIIINNYSSEKRFSMAEYKIISFPETEIFSSDTIESLEFSIRTYNCLRRADIKTITDLLKVYNEGRLMAVRNLGRRSLEEINNKLLELHLVKEDKK